MNESELQALRVRYNAAFDAHHEVMTRNYNLAISGHGPTAEQLAEEDQARDALRAARRDYLAALSLPSRDGDE